MALLLNVPYKDKDIVKEMGAKWNPTLKKWYVENKKDYGNFRYWISEKEYFSIICDYIYIIEGSKKCFKCGKNTRVICYGIENYFEFIDEDEGTDEFGFIEDSFYYNGNIDIAAHVEPMPNDLLKYIQSKYNYKMRFSKTINQKYLANCCDNCDMLQGDFYLFDEPNSPFFVENPKIASKLKIYKIPLEYDLVVDEIEVSFYDNDNFMKKYSQFINMNF